MSKTKPPPVTGFCRLCGLERELQESHIVPNFVTKHKVKNSATGNLRSVAQPNQRIQDGIKPHLLCYECEQLFSKYEDAFARSIFFPLHNKKAQTFSYDERTFRCAISIIWRVLVYVMQLKEHPSDEVRHKERRAEKVWRHFLLGHISSVGNLKPHMFFLDTISVPEEAAPVLSPFINRYLLGAVEIQVIDGEGMNVIVYVKMSRVLLLGVVTLENMPISDESELEMANATADASISDAVAVPRAIRQYMNDQATKHEESVAKTSSKQKERIRVDVKANEDKFKASESYRAIRADVDIFGHTAFRAANSKPETDNQKPETDGRKNKGEK